MNIETKTKLNTDPRRKRTLPKVLIIGQPLNHDTGGGITLSNLFEGWDKERLAVVCSGYLINHNTDYESCSNYYQIGNIEHKWIFPFNLIKRKYYSGPIRVKDEAEGQNPIKKAAPNWRKTAIMDY